MPSGDVTVQVTMTPSVLLLPTGGYKAAVEFKVGNGKTRQLLQGVTVHGTATEAMTEATAMLDDPVSSGLKPGQPITIT